MVGGTPADILRAADAAHVQPSRLIGFGTRVVAPRSLPPEPLGRRIQRPGANDGRPSGRRRTIIRPVPIREASPWSRHWPLLAAAAVIGITGLLIGLWGIHQFRPNELGHLGDFIGGTVGPLWSIAGLLLVYVAYLAQREQLKIQQDEIREAGEQVSRQRLETTFFNLLQMHHQLVAAFSTYTKAYQPWSAPASGNPLVEKRARDCLDVFLRRLGGEVRADKVDESSRVDRLARAYPIFYFKHEAPLGAYFGNIRAILEIIASAAHEEYARVYRAQFSETELALLLYHAGWRALIGDGDLLRTLMRYDFFATLRPEMLIDASDIDVIRGIVAA